VARQKLIRLERAVALSHPSLEDPAEAIREGRVTVDGIVRTNPATQLRQQASMVLDADTRLRGSRKLQPALDRFPVAPDGAVALDAGASAGGFTTALLEAGAARVYAVDVGFGQLVGALRQNPRVVVLERTNVAQLDRERIADPIDLMTLDLGYLALSEALGQLGRIAFAPGARLVGLVKPMFELRLPRPPTEETLLLEALDRARRGAEAAGWTVEDWMHSPVRGSRGAAELFLFARRSAPA
jgi:23S rRNA (cytidine1920-2'-O)/16S rRNA (cytidine1409-2'-O)-methyltransferase